MQGGIYLGKVWGIPIRMHYSWFIIFFLVTWTLVVGYFPRDYRQLPTLLSWLLAALTSLLFAVSVVLHELGHCFFCLRNQVPVKGVTLFIFGGLAEITEEPKTPGAEFRIAIAGPAVSLALGILFSGLWLLSGSLPALAAPAQWLGRINLSLALFNMIPGFPLDGGRVFRSMVWKWTGNLKRATRISANLGQLVAFGFIGWGLFTILGGDFFSGLWLAFIGWFMQNAAASSYSQSTLQQSMQGATVWQVMSRDLPLIPAGTTLDHLVNVNILIGRRRFFLVTGGEGNELCGLVTIHEINAVPPEKWKFVTAGEVMVPCSQMVEVAPEMPLLEALRKMDDANVSQVPVRAGSTVVGMLSREQIVRYVRQRAEVGS